MRVNEGEKPETVLSIDPGTAKWGLAVVRRTGECVVREVVPAEAAPARVKALLAELRVPMILLGDRTGSEAALRLVEPMGTEVARVPEHGTTLLARGLYWRDHPPRGWRKLVPLGLLTPPVLLDGYAAEALALRYFVVLH